MSTCGIHFLHRWLANKVPATANAMSVDELHIVFAAKSVGTKRARNP